MIGMYGRTKEPATYLGWNKEHPYVSRITGLGRGEFSKVEIHGYLDYSGSNSVGSRGIFKVYFLDDGLYEVLERPSWKRNKLYYLLIEDETKTKMSLEEAVRWLEAKEKNT
jgi:hypothetical protein